MEKTSSFIWKVLWRWLRMGGICISVGLVLMIFIKAHTLLWDLTLLAMVSAIGIDIIFMLEEVTEEIVKNGRKR